MWLLVLIIVLILVFSLASAYWASRRQKALHALATSLGLDFSPGRDYSFDENYPFLGKLCQGRNRYAFNIIYGVHSSHPVCVFDYHYETTSTDSKGRRKTNHHYFSFLILRFDRNFPELIITRESWLSKIAQWFGYDDIDFESAEFSRRFKVRSPDKKFAYDICHPLMIEYLLYNSDLNFEIERNCLTLFFGSCLAVEQIQYNLDRLVALRERFPSYLMEP